MGLEVCDLRVLRDTDRIKRSAEPETTVLCQPPPIVNRGVTIGAYILSEIEILATTIARLRLDSFFSGTNRHDNCGIC